jgi:hypothetical protein
MFILILIVFIIAILFFKVNYALHIYAC